ncbi:hypothetical protein D3C81_2222330 [compost metagenome]
MTCKDCKGITGVKFVELNAETAILDNIIKAKLIIIDFINVLPIIDKKKTTDMIDV